MLGYVLVANFCDLFFDGSRWMSNRNAAAALSVISLVLILAGLILGIAGVCQKAHRKGLAIAGLAICGGLTLLIVAALLNWF